MNYDQGSLSQFHHRIRILHCLDADELERAGVFDAYTHRETAEVWRSFRDNPCQFFIRADDETARRLWALVEKREAGK